MTSVQAWATAAAHAAAVTSPDAHVLDAELDAQLDAELDALLRRLSAGDHPAVVAYLDAKAAADLAALRVVLARRAAQPTTRRAAARFAPQISHYSGYPQEPTDTEEASDEVPVLRKSTSVSAARGGIRA